MSRSLIPPWDLEAILEGLKGLPFEPLQGADLKFVSLKTAAASFGVDKEC